MYPLYIFIIKLNSDHQILDVLATAQVQEAQADLYVQPLSYYFFLV